MCAFASPVEAAAPPAPAGDRSAAADRWVLAAVLLVILAVWLEPPGSYLAEPDEPRYAEIPREMLATGDFVVPRLNGAPYFEKPPLLYWANAASFRFFGQTAWAARLPTRVAGLGTLLLVFYGVGRMYGRTRGLAAAALFAASPLPFTFSRLNLTDGLLTFFFSATLFSAFATLRRRSENRPTAALSALTGSLAAAGFLTKGLVAVVLTGAIVVFWCLATSRWRSLDPLLFGPAVPVFLLLSIPWLWAAERRHPGFLQFFFVHEHFQRFATPVAARPGAIYYFLLVFVAGFLPALSFFFSGVRGIGRRDPEGLFFLIWFAVVLVFFSVSRSKLSPYLFPAFPAAAALAARGFERCRDSIAAWLASALIATSGLAVAVSLPGVRSAISAEHAFLPAILGAASLFLGSWGAFLIARRRPWLALAALTSGWGGLYLALALIYPRTPYATDVHELARTAARHASERGAAVVAYQTYVQGLPWELKSLVPVADHTGELEPWFLPEKRRREIFWSREDFWSAWSRRPLVVVTRARDRQDFERASPPAELRKVRGKYCVLTNFR